MEKKDFIQSGMLERFILGELSPQEERIVTEALASDDALRVHFNTLESQFEEMALENAIEPTAFPKKNLMASIARNENEIKQKSSHFSTSFFIAASVALICGLGLLWLFLQNSNMQTQLVELEQSLDQLEQKAAVLEDERNQNEQLLAKFNNPNTIRLVLRGNDLLPEATAITYINHEERTVMLDAKDLPELATDKDYQLWSDVEGEMIDMGVLPKDQELSTMTYIADASSLNITIEPAGGSNHPTVSQLISNVYLQ